MITRAMTLVVAAAFILTGCEGMFATFVQLNVEGPLPEPVIRLEQKLTVSEFHVHKFKSTGLAGKEVQRIEYWGVAARTTKQERNLGEIRYGNVPDGYYEYTAARPLDPGYYSVSVAARVHSVARGAFVVVRTKDGRMRALNIGEPYSYGEDFFVCIHDSRYIEDKVRACLMKSKTKISGKISVVENYVKGRNRYQRAISSNILCGRKR